MNGELLLILVNELEVANMLMLSVMVKEMKVLGAVYNNCWKTTYAGESSGSGLMLVSGGFKLKVGSLLLLLLVVKVKEVVEKEVVEVKEEVEKEVVGDRQAARPCM